MYLARLIKPLGVKVTRIASGMPVGGDLEYADELTLGRALEGRSRARRGLTRRASRGRPPGHRLYRGLHGARSRSSGPALAAHQTVRLDRGMTDLDGTPGRATPDTTTDPALDPVVEPPPSRRASLVLSAGLVALIVVLVATFLAFTTDDGADTAEGSAREMMTAIQAGDVTGVLAQLPPGERRAITDDALDLVPPLRRLGWWCDRHGPDRGRAVRVRRRRHDHDPAGQGRAGHRSGRRHLHRGSWRRRASPALTERGGALLDRNGVTVDEAASTYRRDSRRIRCGSSPSARVVAGTSAWPTAWPRRCAPRPGWRPPRWARDPRRWVPTPRPKP